MSRIGKNPITIPEGVTVDIKDNEITVKRKIGELKQDYSEIDIKVEDGEVILERTSEEKVIRSKHGLYRALIQNMVIGVSEGYTKELELIGVGYRAKNQGQKLEITLGFSHTVVMMLAPEVKVETITAKGKNPIIKLTANDKQLVGQVAAKIRSYLKHGAYKGKCIKYCEEYIRREAGKAS